MKKTRKSAKPAIKGVQIVKSGGLTWVNISKPNTTTLGALQEMYPFLQDFDLRDCLPPFQRPKLLSRENYLFMILLYPTYDPETRMVRPVEVDFFIGEDFVVTSHAQDLPTLVEMARDCMSDGRVAGLRLGDSPPKMLFSLLHELMVSVFPILTRMSNDILLAEKEIFNENGHDTVRQILRIKSNIVQCRQAMQGHKAVIRKCLERSNKLFGPMPHMDMYFEDLIGHTKEIWDYLENDKETINAVYDSHVSLVTHVTSQSSQRLAALAFVIFPTTLVAAVFAMRAEHMPILGSPNDFWIMLGFVLLTLFGTLGYLRWKKWL